MFFLMLITIVYAIVKAVIAQDVKFYYYYMYMIGKYFSRKKTTKVTSRGHLPELAFGPSKNQPSVLKFMFYTEIWNLLKKIQFEVSFRNILFRPTGHDIGTSESIVSQHSKIIIRFVPLSVPLSHSKMNSETKVYANSLHEILRRSISRLNYFWSHAQAQI